MALDFACSLCMPARRSLTLEFNHKCTKHNEKIIACGDILHASERAEWTIKMARTYNGRRRGWNNEMRRGCRIASGKGRRQKCFSLDTGMAVAELLPNLFRGLTSLLSVALRPADDRRGAGVLWIGGIVIFAYGVMCSAALFAQAQPSSASAQTATIHWERVPLGDAVARLGGVFKQSIFVDRRLDRSRRVSLNADAASLDDVLQAMASEASLGFSRLGALVYLGPREAAEQLRTVAAVREREASQLSAALRGALRRKEAVTWPRLTEPRMLITALIERAGWRISQSERIPHDLWPAGELPKLTLAEHLTVLLIGFDLSFKVDGGRRTIEIVPFTPVTISRRYRTIGNASEHVAELNQQLPTAVARVDGDTLRLDGRVEDHERLAELLQRPTRRADQNRARRGTKQVYTLRVEEQPVGKVLHELATRLHWRLEIDENAIRAAGLTLEKRVSFSVENSDEDELLKALLSPAALEHRREGGQLAIVPRQPE